MFPSSALIKVFPLDHSYAIVADNDEWICEVSTNTGGFLGMPHSGQYIKGKAKYLPISFNFFYRNVYKKTHQKINSVLAFEDAQQFLLNYASKNNTIFSGLVIETIENSLFLVSGSYFDNVSSGRFAFYIQSRENIFCNYYCMFIKIQTNLLDDHSAASLFKEAFDLVTPLIMP
jgi:hypothetical protein